MKSEFEIINIEAPNGNTIPCTKDGSVLVPIGKVKIYGMGKVEFTEDEQDELDKLKQERKDNQKSFSKSPEKIKRLEYLNRRKRNAKKSQENLQNLLKVGMSDC